MATQTLSLRAVVAGVEQSGLPPVLKLLDSALPVIDQGVTKRPFAMSVYIEPWHPDVLEFVRMKRPARPENSRTEKIFYGLWTNDLL